MQAQLLNPFLKIIFLTFLSLFALPVVSEIYRWVDENGKVQFSDRPPSESLEESQVEQVHYELKSIDSSFNFPKVKLSDPLKNDSRQRVKVAQLEHVDIEVSEGEAGKDLAVGRLLKFTNFSVNMLRKMRIEGKWPEAPLECEGGEDLALGRVASYLKVTRLVDKFTAAFESNGYATPSGQKFSLQERSGADLSLAATISDIKIMHCATSASLAVQEGSQTSTYMRVDWEVFDNLSRKVVYKTRTPGIDDSLREAPRPRGFATSLELAFRSASEQLLADPEFVSMLKSAPLEAGKAQFPSDKKLAVSLSYGNNSGDFLRALPQIKGAAVTIRTNSGHGSGFIISESGYLLTNNHVVKNSSAVIAIVSGRHYPARVVRTNAQRDIALLKIEPDEHIVEVRIASSVASVGEELFVVGTPLEESLDFSITKGIVSAYRIQGGQDFFQTDAAVNPGNSGGPVFNRFGEVIAVTVSGIFFGDGASANINYLIPIKDALGALGIDPRNSAGPA